MPPMPSPSAHRLNRCARRAALIAAALVLSACVSGPGNGPAYIADHPIVSPRVPFYRYDDTRMVEVDYVAGGNLNARYWLVDRARGIDAPITEDATPAKCPYSGGTWIGAFHHFEARLNPSVRLPVHYASDNPDLLVFADNAPRKYMPKDETDYGYELYMLVSTDGGAHFALRSVLINPPPRRRPGEQYADYSDIPIMVDDYDLVRFVVARAGTVYVGFGNARPSAAAPPDALVMHQGERTAVFAFDPASPAPQQRARLLHGAELLGFALPQTTLATHGTDAALLARITPPGNVVYNEDARRRYVESLRTQFPQWAAQQRVEIGRERYLTTNERLWYVDAARRRGDPCAAWAVE